MSKTDPAVLTVILNWRTLIKYFKARTAAISVVVGVALVATFIALGSGNGVVAAFVDAMQGLVGKPLVLVEYSEHALSHSADAEAVCYIQLNVDGQRVCGVGRSHDIVQASLNGILGALNRAFPAAEAAA